MIFMGKLLVSGRVTWKFYRFSPASGTPTCLRPTAVMVATGLAAKHGCLVKAGMT